MNSSGEIPAKAARWCERSAESSQPETVWAGAADDPAGMLVVCSAGAVSVPSRHRAVGNWLNRRVEAVAVCDILVDIGGEKFTARTALPLRKFSRDLKLDFFSWDTRR